MRDQNYPSNNALLATRTTQGEVGVNSVLLNLLTGIVYKRKYSKYKFNFLHIQNGESTAGKYFRVSWREVSASYMLAFH